MNCQEVVELSPLYLSGELGDARGVAFAAHVKACPDCARDLELDTRLRGALLAERVDSRAADLQIRRRISRHVRWRRLSIAAGVAAMLVIGMAAFPRVYKLATQDSAVFTAAAQDHRREVVDHERRNWVSEPDQMHALTTRLGISTSAPSLIGGYRLERAKLCRLNGRIFLHAVYSDGAREYSLFLRPLDGQGSASVRVSQAGGECVAGFETASTSAIVVADRARDVAEFASISAAAL